MENCSRETDTVKKNQMEMLEIKVIRSEVKNSFEELNDRLDTVEGRTSEFQVSSIEMINSETKRTYCRAFLVVQWLRIRLPMQGTWVRALVREYPTCCGATKPVCHNY